ncbi:MAG: 6-phosphogluconolactonase [Myxococcales bacterium]|nr:6-phosphogluconolactonase [Myxococcota bacterium]MDW8282759.1 6-phosphogluconolactonase [Myxococcales bacterium]
MNRRAPEIWIGDDPATLAREGARRVAEAARRAIAARGRFVFVLSGGNTPRRLYRLLAAEEHGIDWRRVEFLFSDERMVPYDDPESNYRMVRETLLDHIPAAPEHTHPIPTDCSPAEAAAAYEAELRRVLDPKEPRPDLVLLGMGADGHTASIFPGSPLLEECRDEETLPEGRPPRSSRSYREERLCVPVEDAPKPPHKRVTLTPYLINQGRQILVLVTGEDKVAAVSAALESDAEPSEIPIRAIAPESGVVSWLLDRKAARALTNAPW